MRAKNCKKRRTRIIGKAFMHFEFHSFSLSLFIPQLIQKSVHKMVTSIVRQHNTVNLINFYESLLILIVGGILSFAIAFLSFRGTTSDIRHQNILIVYIALSNLWITSTVSYVSYATSARVFSIKYFLNDDQCHK